MKNLTKKILSILFLSTIICLSVDRVFGQQTNKLMGYSIIATIAGLPDSSLFYLTKSTSTKWKIDTVARTKSSKGIFKFNGVLRLPGELHWIVMDTIKLKLGKGKANWTAVILEDSAIQINGAVEKWPDVEISGSTATNVYKNYHKKNNQYVNDLNAVEGIKATNSTVEEWKNFVNEFINSNKNSNAAPLLIMKANALNLNEKQQFYDALSAQTKDSFYGKELAAYLVKERHFFGIEKKQGKLAVGRRMPDFKISTPEGKTLSVLDIISRADYTLVDFWASWCVPCRSAIPKIKEVYNAYHDKGFNVLGISTDKKEEEWKKALVQDDTKWDHGLDNIDWASKNIFGLTAIPAYILLDRNGVIVQADYFSGKEGFKILKRDEITLSKDLKEIIEELFKSKQ